MTPSEWAGISAQKTTPPHPCDMTDWITDRLPTAFDADGDGDVAVRWSPNVNYAKHLHWSYVAEGAPWKHSSFWRPTAPAGEGWITDRLPSERNGDEDGEVMVFIGPEPHNHTYRHWQLVRQGQVWKPRPHRMHTLTEPALAVGQKWRRRNGDVVIVTRYDDSDNTFLAGDWVRPTGRALGGWGAHPFDLVELVSDDGEPVEPTKLVPRRFVSITRSISSHGQVLDAIADDGTAWHKVLHAPLSQWRQTTPLPNKEARH